MARTTGLLSLIVLLAACGDQEQHSESPQATYSVDDARISVSGISSGAYMAGQLHVAQAASFVGVGLLAGGPYACAQGSVQRALGACMTGDELDLQALHDLLRDSAASGLVDDISAMGDDRAWIFHGTGDALVNARVTEAAAAFYAEYLAPGAVSFVGDVETVHGFPTLDTGSACNEMTAPFLLACDFDAAGELLRALHGPLDPRTAASGTLSTVAQPGGADASMLDEAFLYVPASCADGAACGVHIALHGCKQSAEAVGDAFVAGAGYNEWAEANKLLVLYPQAASSRIAPLNPYGCWDWWGYTGPGYATRDGEQIKVIMATLESLSGSPR
jgi:hypothetical protein